MVDHNLFLLVLCGLAVVSTFFTIAFVSDKIRENSVWVVDNVLSLDRELLANFTAGFLHSEGVTIDTVDRNANVILSSVAVASNKSDYLDTTYAMQLRTQLSELQDSQDALQEELLTSRQALDALNDRLTKEGVTVKRRPTGTPFEPIPESMKSIQNLSAPNDRWQSNCYKEHRSNTTVCFVRVD